MRTPGFSASQGSCWEEGTEGERGKEREEAGIFETASVLYCKELLNKASYIYLAHPLALLRMQ